MKEGGAKTITKNIRMLCKERGISVTDLERILGFGNGLIGKWENSSPSISRLKLVADYFCVPVDALLEDNAGAKIKEGDKSGVRKVTK